MTRKFGQTAEGTARHRRNAGVLLAGVVALGIPAGAAGAETRHEGPHWKITQEENGYVVRATTAARDYRADDVTIVGAGGVDFAAAVLTRLEDRYEIMLLDLNRPFAAGSVRGQHECESMHFTEGGLQLGVAESRVELECSHQGKNRALTVPITSVPLLPWAADG